jgi:hypothetical protein
VPVNLIIDGAALEEILQSPAGPVGVFMLERGELVKNAARGLAPVDTGCLRDSIVKRFADTGGGLSVLIQSDTSPCSPTHESYSLFVHEGTVAHNIPNAFGYGPDFGIGGRFGGMFHPGTKAVPFLRDALDVLNA